MVCPVDSGALSLDERAIVLGLSLTLQARAVGGYGQEWWVALAPAKNEVYPV